METVSKLCHDYLQSRPQKKMIPYYLNQLPLVELLRFMVVFFLSAVEGYYILHKNRPIFSIIIPLSFLLLLYLINYCFSRPAQTYLVDFSCYKPPNFCRVPSSCFLEHMSMFGTFDNESIDFMAKVLASSGQGQRTCLPPSLFFIPPRSYHRESIEEVHMVFFPVMEDLLLKAKLSPRDLDILIVNCSGLCPSPSLASIVINRQGISISS
ncbi:hypothetical protein Nepgr_010910 [Nepenthes gracilis]|uniref:FAE domain-containing protein n=1 Tax=Nepenthes gracilis TaxID=150966 RepID=A0AAD3SE53_NEPGR|nr:hypothetical protein Nepgr_010910 [Nepenthes gracilis]